MFLLQCGNICFCKKFHFRTWIFCIADNRQSRSHRSCSLWQKFFSTKEKGVQKRRLSGLNASYDTYAQKAVFFCNFAQFSPHVFCRRHSAFFSNGVCHPGSNVVKFCHDIINFLQFFDKIHFHYATLHVLIS